MLSSANKPITMINSWKLFFFFYWASNLGPQCTDPVESRGFHLPSTFVVLEEKNVAKSLFSENLNQPEVRMFSNLLGLVFFIERKKNY